MFWEGFIPNLRFRFPFVFSDLTMSDLSFLASTQVILSGGMW